MVDLPTVVCCGDSNTYGAVGSTGRRHSRDVRWPGVVARASATSPGGGPPAVRLVAPPPLGTLTIASELWGFGASTATSAGLAPFYREVAARASAAFLDAGALVATDPSDGVHVDPAAHGILGRAVALAVAGPLPGSSAPAG